MLGRVDIGMKRTIAAPPTMAAANNIATISSGLQVWNGKSRVFQFKPARIRNVGNDAEREETFCFSTPAPLFQRLRLSPRLG